MQGTTPSRLRGIAAVLLGAATAACTAAAAPPRNPAPVGAEEAARIASARPDSGRYPWTEADARFMTMMIHHHAQAIVMARLAPTHDASPSVRTLAGRVINAQQDEIATMRQWLIDRGQAAPVPSEELYHGNAGHHGHEALMPGMLSNEQLARLDAARGAEFDRLFLTFMIQHHRGATEMVRELFSHPGAGEDETVFKFASDVNVDQETEIARMQKMLAELIFGPAPQP
ncbi:MAG TPA: DUF305 domain-containing protein [Longimicrobium sp.]|nr:DUF305 domain-containing protein [Longimicrobium sp.]